MKAVVIRVSGPPESERANRSTEETGIGKAR